MYSPVHFNGNLLCAVDTETSGLSHEKHDILQLTIIPLSIDLRVSQEFPPFDIKIKPFRPENVDPEIHKVNPTLWKEASMYGLDRYDSVTRFEEWFARLNLPERKKIVPLGANYSFDRDFIREWLGGPVNYEFYFRNDYRDIQQAASFLNDQAAWMGERIPFPKLNLSYLCSQLQVTNNNPHDSAQDCLATIECYRKLLRYTEFQTMLVSQNKPGILSIEEVSSTNNSGTEPSCRTTEQQT